MAQRTDISVARAGCKQPRVEETGIAVDQSVSAIKSTLIRRSEEKDKLASQVILSLFFAAHCIHLAFIR